MENNNNAMGSKKKYLPIIIAVAAILVVAIIVAVLANRDKEPETPVQPSPIEQPVDGVEPGFEDGAELGEGSEVEVTNPVLVDAVRHAPGANLISTEGQVVTDTGEAVRTDVVATSPEAPRQTVPVTKDQVAENSIFIDVSASGYSPNEFTVKAGEAITLALTSTDQWSHNIKFEDPSLRSAGTAVSAGTTRAISFNAPTTPGEYVFFCDIPGHRNRGEVGKMIVE